MKYSQHDRLTIAATFLSLIILMLLSSAPGYADEAADIARLLEPNDSYSQTMPKHREGEIDRDERRAPIKAIKQAKKQLKKERYQAA